MGHVNATAREKVALEREDGARALGWVRETHRCALNRARWYRASSAAGLLAATASAIAGRLGTWPGASTALFGTALLGFAAAALAAWRARAAARAARSMVPDLLTLELVVEALEHQRGPDLIVVPAAMVTSAAGRVARLSTEVLPARPALRRAFVIAAVTASAAVFALLWGSGRGPARVERWTFTEAVDDPAELGLHISAARSGAWRLEDDHDATGARALVNGAGSADAPPATAITARARRDVRVATRCKPLAEAAARSCGVVFRWADDRHHYLARLDTSAGTVTLALVLGGRERALAVRTAPVAQGRWHDVMVEARGDHLAVELDGARVIDMHDPSLPNAGRAGLWSPPAGAAHFDELSIGTLEPVAHPTELLPFLLWTQPRGAVSAVQHAPHAMLPSGHEVPGVVPSAPQPS